MEIIINFGYRYYIFYSQKDIIESRGIYAHCTGTLDEFETQLEAAHIDFCYDLY